MNTETKKEPAAAATATSSKKKKSTKNNDSTKTKKSQPPVKWNGKKIFDGPANDMEREVSDYILSRMTAKLADRITDKKLTLKGCLENCFNKGKKYEIRNGNRGFAPVSAEQHWKWVCSYFGLEYKPIGETSDFEPPKITVSSSSPSEFDSLLDF